MFRRSRLIIPTKKKCLIRITKCNTHFDYIKDSAPQIIVVSVFGSFFATVGQILFHPPSRIPYAGEIRFGACPFHRICSAQRCVRLLMTKRILYLNEAMVYQRQSLCQVLFSKLPKGVVFSPVS